MDWIPDVLAWAVDGLAELGVWLLSFAGALLATVGPYLAPLLLILFVMWMMGLFGDGK